MSVNLDEGDDLDSSQCTHGPLAYDEPRQHQKEAPRRQRACRAPSRTDNPVDIVDHPEASDFRNRPKFRTLKPPAQSMGMASGLQRDSDWSFVSQEVPHADPS
jgi:hypothetical protein